MGFERLLGQEDVVRKLLRVSRKPEKPHAFLFAGPEGTGKQAAAVALAQALNCREDPLGCEICSHCRRIAEGNHPDVQLIEPEDGLVIKIDQVRRLVRAIGLRPLEAAYKVYLIQDAEKMNIYAANSFLKTLEEPPPQVVIILLSTKPSALLPTIRSRCLRLNFRPLPTRLLAELLMQNRNVSPEDAELMARAGGGSLARAVAWSEGENWLERQRLLQFLATRDTLLLPAVADVWSRDEESVRCCLRVVSSWLRDCVATAGGIRDEELVNADWVLDSPTGEKQATESRIGGLGVLGVEEAVFRIAAVGELLDQHLNLNRRLLLEMCLLSAIGVISGSAVALPLTGRG